VPVKFCIKIRVEEYERLPSLLDKYPLQRAAAMRVEEETFTLHLRLGIARWQNRGYLVIRQC